MMSEPCKYHTYQYIEDTVECLYDWILCRNFCFTTPTLTAEDQPAEYRHHIIPMKLTAACHAMRWRCHNRFMQRNPANTHIEEASDGNAEYEDNDVRDKF